VTKAIHQAHADASGRRKEGRRPKRGKKIASAAAKPKGKVRKKAAKSKKKTGQRK